MSDTANQQRQWLAALVQTTGRSLTAIARKAGVHDSTVTRFMNSAKADYQLSERTIRLIAQSEGVPFGETPHPLSQWFKPYGATSRDFDGVRPVARDEIVEPLVSKFLDSLDPALEVWRQVGRDLQDAGIHNDDLLILDRRAPAELGDLVIVEWTSGQVSGPGYFARVFVPPYVMTAQSPLTRPQLVDNLSVRVIGKVIASFRSRQKAAM